MYLCICNAIRERDVEGLLHQGLARTVSDVFRHLDKEPQCGSCACAVRDRLKAWTGEVGTALPVAAE
jgi:bacterioferritin-associated ferredoxin